MLILILYFLNTGLWKSRIFIIINLGASCISLFAIPYLLLSIKFLLGILIFILTLLGKLFISTSHWLVLLSLKKLLNMRDPSYGTHLMNHYEAVQISLPLNVFINLFCWMSIVKLCIYYVTSNFISYIPMLVCNVLSCCLSLSVLSVVLFLV